MNEKEIRNKAIRIARMRALGFNSEDELDRYDADMVAKTLAEQARQAKTKAYELRIKPYLDSVKEAARQQESLAEKEIVDAMTPFINSMIDAIKPIAEKYNVNVEFASEGGWDDWWSVKLEELSSWVNCKYKPDLRPIAISMMEDEESEEGEPKDVYEEAEMCGARPY